MNQTQKNLDLDPVSTAHSLCGLKQSFKPVIPFLVCKMQIILASRFV